MVGPDGRDLRVYTQRMLQLALHSESTVVIRSKGEKLDFSFIYLYIYVYIYIYLLSGLSGLLTSQA